MDWYIVIKTINGRRYRYRQKTWREGKRVRTRSEYIGPVGDESKPDDLAGAKTLPIPFPTKRSELTGQIIEDVFDDLLRDPGNIDEWEQGWDEDFIGNLVVPNDDLESLYRTIGVRQIQGSDSAYFHPDEDLICLPPKSMYFNTGANSATERYYRTFCHELVHWTGHKKRLKRITDLNFAIRAVYAREELVAEAGAYLLMKAMGCPLADTTPHRAYFADWLTQAGDRDEALAHAKKHAVRAVRYILKRGIISK